MPERMFTEWFRSGQGGTLGLIGVGKFGSELKRRAEQIGLRTLLCDPPRSLRDAEDLNESLHADWGNGMGGCDFSQERTETFVPVSEICRYADVIAVQVPLNEATTGMIDSGFLAACRDGVTVWIFSDPAAVHEDVRRDPRLRLCTI